ncbi:MAG TPA: tetratricopeptide repeat protein, partial [Bacteroidales bacterium]|nr:tetratricopeptide repeat protein [Bacteroidales bacterium]
ADAWMGLGVCYDESGRSQEALSFIEKAIRLTPTIPEYWFIQGDILIKLSRTEEGISSYRKVIELDPDDTDIWLDLSVVYADRKDFEQGYEVLKEGLVYHENHPDYHYGLAYCLFMMGRKQEGEESLLKALGMDYEGHQRLFKTFPEAKDHPGIAGAIGSFRNP